MAKYVIYNQTRHCRDRFVDNDYESVLFREIQTPPQQGNVFILPRLGPTVGSFLVLVYRCWLFHKNVYRLIIGLFMPL